MTFIHPPHQFLTSVPPRRVGTRTLAIFGVVLAVVVTLLISLAVLG